MQVHCSFNHSADLKGQFYLRCTSFSFGCKSVTFGALSASLESAVAASTVRERKRVVWHFQMQFLTGTVQEVMTKLQWSVLHVQKTILYNNVCTCCFYIMNMSVALVLCILSPGYNRTG